MILASIFSQFLRSFFAKFSQFLWSFNDQKSRVHVQGPNPPINRTNRKKFWQKKKIFFWKRIEMMTVNVPTWRQLFDFEDFWHQIRVGAVKLLKPCNLCQTRCKLVCFSLVIHSNLVSMLIIYSSLALEADKIVCLTLANPSNLVIIHSSLTLRTDKLVSLSIVNPSNLVPVLIIYSSLTLRADKIGCLSISSLFE